MASPADTRQAYVHVLGLEHHSSDPPFFVYIWPAGRNGTEHDRFITIEEFSDGSVSIYLNADELDFKTRIIQLRRMANPD